MKKTKFSLLATSLLLAVATSATAFADKVRLLETDTDALLARRDIIKSAKNEILVEYFAAGRDSMTAAAMALLIEKAREGVKVKMVVDSFANEVPLSMLQDLVRLGVRRLSVDDQTKVEQNLEVKMFNQVTSLSDLRTVNHHDHSKILVVDGKVAVMGGRNATSEYFGLNEGHNFIDMDALVFGKIAQKIKKNYMTLWEGDLADEVVGGENHTMEEKVYEFCKPRPMMYKEHSDQKWLDCMNRMIPEVRNGKTNIFEIAKEDFNKNAPSYRPLEAWESEAVEIPDEDIYFAAQSAVDFNSRDSKNSTLTSEYLKLLSSAKKSIRLTTPYLLATPELFATLKKLREAKVEIELVTNSATSTDSTVFYAEYRKHIDAAIAIGVKVFETQGTNTLHAKTALIDNETLIIGSFNLDPLSSYINREVALIIHDKQHKGLASGLASFMDKRKQAADATASEDESMSRATLFQRAIVRGLIFFDPLLKRVL